jgi:hypothetical protein
MSLLSLQRQFGGWLRDGDADAAPSGMRVYQNNYRASLSACLEDSFARTRAWIGEGAFEQAMIRHIHRVPPSSWTLDAYPRDFPDTLDLLYPDDPEVAELAWLELALAEAFVAPDAQRLTQADALNLDWDNTVLRFSPTLDFRRVVTNADAIWSALASKTLPPPAVRLDSPHVLLVWRRDLISQFRLIDAREDQALALARSGVPFARLCDAIVAAEGEEEGVALAGQWLGRWLADGLLTNQTGNSERAC